MEKKKYFLVGIGGVGMQAVARLLAYLGHDVAGADIRGFAEQDQLEKEGIKVFIGHDAGHVTSDMTAVIYSAAVPENNPEILEAKKLGIPVRRRLELVGEMMQSKTGIAVTGTHGKTTTTTMIAMILEAAGRRPTALIGAEVRRLKSNVLLGDGQELVVEACEYTRSFLDLNPRIAVITNIEEDHLDYYADLEDIKKAFRQFIDRLPADGLVIANGDDKNTRELLENIPQRVIFAGFDEGNDIQIKNPEYVEGRLYFSVNGERLYLQIPGRHNVSNAVLAWAVAHELGVDDATIRHVLEEEFHGASRRFEMIGTAKGITFVDDYGHHPTEIRATLEAARKYFVGRRLVVVFHPHQYSRTMLLLEDFAKSFKDADMVIVAPIFPARFNEEKDFPITSEKLVEEINKVSGNAQYFGDFPEIETYLKGELKADDVVLTLGAGKADIFGQELLKYLREEEF